MDDVELKNKLIKLGMLPIDADTLISIAKKNNTSVSRVFFMSLRGLYFSNLLLVVTYFFFTYKTDVKSLISFSVAYISIVLILYFVTPSLKTLFWSLKVLINLKGR
ncbi:Inner membrane protein [Yersinia entomophaga]